MLSFCCPVSTLVCAFMKSESLSVKCPTMALFTVQDPLGFTVSFQPVQWSLSPSGGRYLHRATRSAWTPAKVLTLFLSARERERHRESQVCLLQFSFHPKITLDAHIADIMSCVYFWFAHIFQRWNIAQQWCRVCYVEGFKKMSFLSAVYLIRPLCLIIPAAFTSATQLINSVSNQISVSPRLCGAT